MLKLYKFFCYILIPLAIINLYLRILKKKEDNKRYKERFGNKTASFQSYKKIIWLHAASVGEFKSSDLIINQYYKSFNILVTTTTRSSGEYIKERYKNKVIHQYLPIDVPYWCSRFLNYWKPNLVLWIESDIWPNMLKIIKDKKIKSFYLNARLSPKSFKKWIYFNKLYSESLSCFNKIYAQSQDDLKRIEKLHNTRIEYIGNLKLSNIKKIKFNQNHNKLFSIMIVSSHTSEEEKIIKHIKTIIKRERLNICIAPRHPERSSNISNILLKHNLSYKLDSEKNAAQKDVVIVDSFGKLDSYYYDSEIVILGGSFIRKGGHNPIEPAKYGCAIISGNYVYNWQNIYNDMAKEKACIIADEPVYLKKIINEFMMDKNLLENYKKKALDFSNKKFFDNESLFNQINLVLK